MPEVTLSAATERLASKVEADELDYLDQIYLEIFPETTVPSPLLAGDVARIIRAGLEPEELVDLWNVVFPDHHHVWYNEETDLIYYNEEAAEYSDW